jgi:hypothetical protein
MNIRYEGTPGLSLSAYSYIPLLSPPPQSQQGKAKLSLSTPWRHRRDRCLAPNIINLGNRRRWVDIFMSRSLYPRERTPVALEQEAGWASEPDSSASSLVAIPTALAGLPVSTSLQILSPVKIITANIRVKKRTGLELSTIKWKVSTKYKSGKCWISRLLSDVSFYVHY